ncbi:MAG TPA: branched-chain amino acid ABC transporter permease [Ktedonobacterales bacterium]|jgi:branched-chain amino acid transport system permease protein
MATSAKPSASPTTTASPPAAKEGRGWLWSLLGGLVILAFIGLTPFTGDASDLHTWTLILMYCVLAQSWNFIGGFAGYAAFGNAAFFGIGAYTVGLCLQANIPFLVGLVGGALIAGLFAFLLGLPVLRLRGHYFAIATLGIAEALRELVAVRNIGGSGGEVSLFPPGLAAYQYFFYAFLGLSLLCLLITVLLTRNKFGYALVAIRENEQAAEALGIATYWYKVSAFVLSAIPTALAGGLYAYWLIGFDPFTVFDVGISVEMVLLTFLGGAGTILGPLVGAIIFEYGSYQLDVSGFSIHNTLLGAAIVIVTILLPQGLLPLVQEFFQKPAPGAARSNRFIEGARRVRRFIADNGI